MVDILCSLLSDMPNGKNVSTMYESDGGCLQEKRYLGQFIWAIDISRFIDVDTFRKRLAETANTIRCESKVNPYGKAMVPGDPEKVVAKFRTANGIPIAVELVEELNACASNYNIAELKPI
jgi:LDH2 family malate/lactate/ureidoglycolate dehydrogenase